MPPCVKGNHDEYCATDLPLDDFAPSAARAVEWTRKQLTQEDRQWAYIAISSQIMTPIQSTGGYAVGWFTLFAVKQGLE